LLLVTSFVSHEGAGAKAFAAYAVTGVEAALAASGGADGGSARGAGGGAYGEGQRTVELHVSVLRHGLEKAPYFPQTCRFVLKRALLSVEELFSCGGSWGFGLFRSHNATPHMPAARMSNISLLILV